MKARFYYILVWMIAIFAACTPQPKDVNKVSALPPMYPDYPDITIPYNIAPLNFLLRNDADAIEVVAQCGESVLQVNKRGHEICFPIAAWKKFMPALAAKTVLGLCI